MSITEHFEAFTISNLIDLRDEMKYQLLGLTEPERKRKLEEMINLIQVEIDKRINALLSIIV